jgi:uroporphyrinogen-III synthase
MLGMQGEQYSKGFGGMRVLALESRRAAEMEKLISAYSGKAVVAPSMREVPLESNTEAKAFARTLLEGGFDVVIFLTGVGARALARVAQTIYPVEDFVAALRKVAVVARGPKPVTVLKEWGVPIALTAPEPNTWREILRALDENKSSVPLAGRRVAVQEYGVSNRDLLAALTERGAHVTSVPIYEWGLPEDVGPLRAAVDSIARGQIDVALFTSAMQVTNLLRVAAEMHLEDAVRREFSRILIASIGPVTSDRLRESGLVPDLEPAHSKMGYLVTETSQRCAGLLRQKRSRTY